MIQQLSPYQKLCRDMRPYPGRGNQVLRSMISVILVIVISQTLQIPWLALSVVSVFFVTQTNVVITKMTGMLFFVAVTVSILCILLILIVTWNTPFLRILLSSLIFLISVFLMRTSAVGVIFFVVAVVVIYGQTLVDIAPDAESLVRALLWLWVALVYSIAVTLIVNTLLLPAEPARQLRNALLRQLSVIAERLDLSVSGEPEKQDPVNTGLELQAMYKYLRFSIMRDNTGTFDEKRSFDIVTVISELRALSEQLPLVLTDNKDSRAATQMSRVIQDFRRITEQGKTGSLPLPLAAEIKNPVLQTMAQLLPVLIHSTESARPGQDVSASPSPGSGKKTFLVSDAFTNRKYIIFSLKTLLTVLLSYVFYVATDWDGIHTAMISCLIVAQPGLGNIQRKIILRLSGAAIGSLLALFAIVIVIPQLDTLSGVLLLVCPVFLLAFWVTTGPESISYAGVQIAVTFALAVLETFGPVYDLTEVRDRIIGIVAGIVLAGVVHTFIAPEREGAVVMDKLAGILDKLRHKWRSLSYRSKYYRTAIIMEIADCGDLIARVALEPAWGGNEGSHDSLYLRSQEIFLVVKNILFNADKLSLHYREDDCKRAGENGRLMDIYERNLGIISARLRGNLTEKITFPDVSALPECDFKTTAQAMNQSTGLFLRLTDRPAE